MFLVLCNYFYPDGGVEETHLCCVDTEIPDNVIKILTENSCEYEIIKPIKWSRYQEEEIHTGDVVTVLPDVYTEHPSYAGLSENTEYKVLWISEDNLCVLEGYLMLVPSKFLKVKYKLEL